MKNNKLKPVILINSRFNYHKQNTFQQLLLLKGLQITQDPKELKKMIGVRTVAEVYRTLDKMAMRKEYHVALAEAGIDFNYIVKGIKDHVCENPLSNPGTKLKGYQALLKSLGLDEYKGEGSNTSNWEELLVKKIEEDAAKGPKKLQGKKEESTEMYEVIEPEIPASVKASEDKEREIFKSIYEGK